MLRTPFAVAALALVAAALPTTTARAQSTPPAGTVTATGSAVVTPTPVDRTSNVSIAKAVTTAQAEVLPLAIKAARARAEVLATQSGLGLGALIAISDQVPSPFFGFGPFGVDGTFGPGRFCGNVPRYRTTRLPNGSVRRTRNGTRRTCRIPARISTSVLVTYATAVPAPAPAS